MTGISGTGRPARLDITRTAVGTIHPSPGGFPRGRPALTLLAHTARVDELTCSAKGCRSRAAWQLRWNNPKLHTPDRRKIWLACDEHRGSLSAFLDARGFLRDTAAIDDQDRSRDTLEE